MRKTGKTERRKRKVRQASTETFAQRAERHAALQLKHTQRQAKAINCKAWERALGKGQLEYLGRKLRRQLGEM